MKYTTVNKMLPYSIKKVLFGDRKQFGFIPDELDSCWVSWQKTSHDFYNSTQKKGVGGYVNNAGYRILKDIDLSGLRVLEIGPGALFHTPFWQNKPDSYVLVDIDERFLEASSSKLQQLNVNFETRLTTRNAKASLPATDNEFDLVLSFYSLEHIHPIEDYLKELHRVIKPNGYLAGAIPTEGGLAWGMGRILTSRRWLKKNTDINPDKIICWEHPTFAEDILNAGKKLFTLEEVSFWPFKIPLIDINLLTQFKFKKDHA